MMGWFDSVDGFLSGPPGDVDGMHAAAVDLDRMAGELRRLARGLDQRIGDVLGGVNAWRGPAARSFGERWQPVFRSLLTGAGALDDTVQTLRATAAPVAAAQDQHRQAMATLGASAAVTVADVLLGGAGAAASPGHTAVQAITAGDGTALASAFARSALEFERIAGVGRMVAATVPPPTGPPQVPGTGGSGFFDRIAAGVSGQRVLMLEEIRAHLPADLLPPEPPDQTVAAAGVLAGSFTAAVDGDDPQSLAALCSDLAALGHQPLFTTTLFNRLGPQGTLLVAHRLRELGSEDRDAALGAFDEALATATTSPGLDRDVIAGLTHPPGSQDGLDDLVALLRDGVFSTPMLLAAARVADASVFSGTSPVLAALSRNPAAAQQFLLAPYDPAAAGGLPRRDPDALPGLPSPAASHRTNLDAVHPDLRSR
ncbi:MAG: hypothetical protein QOE72_3100 [Chloroflexota bacterium]|nr:hypothetical protein [Chloroflexota bacterium]